MTLAVEIHIEELTPSDISVNTWEDWFKIWLNDLSSYLPEAAGYELSLRLTGDEEIQGLNADYRHKDQPTDVLAFAALEVDFPNPNQALEPLYLGDLVISVETATRQAEQQNHSLTKELAWLAAHGLLHLLGWDHPDEESLAKMLAQQDQLLQLIDILA
jgi:probable rRNA maturation factor